MGERNTGSARCSKADHSGSGSRSVDGESKSSRGVRLSDEGIGFHELIASLLLLD